MKPIPRCPLRCARLVPRWSLLTSYLVMTALSDCKSPYSMEGPDPSKRGDEAQDRHRLTRECAILNFFSGVSVVLCRGEN
jgi:hypothetical protein